MTSIPAKSARCVALLRELNAEFGWQLSDAVQDAYVEQIAPFVPTECPERRMRQIIVNYHADRDLVTALRDPLHPKHDAVWSSWMHQTLVILRHVGLAWSTDVAIESEDFAQIARMALIRAVPSFAYQSRFSTWAHQVIVQSVQRALRDGNARKRATRPDSLDRIGEVPVPLREADQPETLVHSNLLVQQALAILARQSDERLAQIFYLWAVADMRAEDIGELTRLHPSRVRALIVQSRQILQQDLALHVWSAG